MTSKLGIFWIYRHEVIFSHSVPLADGLPYGEAITGTKDHADYWEELRSAGELSVLPHHLQKVAKLFCLPKESTSFEQDLHYCDFSDEQWEAL